MTIVFRDATEADVPACAALLADDPIAATRERDPSDPAYLDGFRRMRAQGGNRLIVAEGEHGAVVGCLQLVIIPGLSFCGASRAEIEGVRVARSHRSRGIGAKLVDHALAEARAEGARLAQLSSSLARADAHRFWLAQGFQRSHAGFKLPL